MQAYDFADLAETLSNQCQDNEALRRTIIGRWYYSAYHQINDWLETNYESVLAQSNGNSHERLTICCNALQRQHMDLAFSTLGRLIKNLKDKRVIADYKLGTACRQFEIESARLNYAEIIKQLNLLKEKYPKIY